MSSLLSHPALVSIPAAVAVIVVVVLFLRSQKDYSAAHRCEREESAKLIKSMVDDTHRLAEEFMGSLQQMQEARITEQKALLDLYREQTICMQTVVAKCQKGN